MGRRCHPGHQRHGISAPCPPPAPSPGVPPTTQHSPREKPLGEAVLQICINT